MGLSLPATAPEQLLPELSLWYESETGRALLAMERALLAPRLGDCFGYNLLQIGIDGRLDLCSDSRILRKLVAGPRVPAAAANPVHCDFEALPFDSDSMDAVVVHHALEFSSNPHALLRELQRIIVPRGRLFVLGFNPWSPHAGRVALGRLRRHGPWRHPLISAGRLCDWMRLLDFAHEPVVYGYHRPWFAALARNRGQVSGQYHAQYWPGGSVYLVDAVRQVARLTPLRPRWREQRAGLPQVLSGIKPGIGRSSRDIDHRNPGNGHS